MRQQTVGRAEQVSGLRAIALYQNGYGQCQCRSEYDGLGHFEPINFGGKREEEVIEIFKEGQIRDQIKNKYCKDNNITLIRIPYWDFDNIENILKEHLKF